MSKRSKKIKATRNMHPRNQEEKQARRDFEDKWYRMFKTQARRDLDAFLRALACHMSYRDDGEYHCYAIINEAIEDWKANIAWKRVQTDADYREAFLDNLSKRAALAKIEQLIDEAIGGGDEAN